MGAASRGGKSKSDVTATHVLVATVLIVDTPSNSHEGCSRNSGERESSARLRTKKPGVRRIDGNCEEQTHQS